MDPAQWAVAYSPGGVDGVCLLGIENSCDDTGCMSLGLLNCFLLLSFLLWLVIIHDFIWFLYTSNYDFVIFKAFYGFGGKLDKLGKAIALVACAVSVLINNDENIPSTSSQIVYHIILFGGGLLTLLDAHRSTPIGTYARLPSQDDGPIEQSALDRKLGHKIGMDFFHGIFMFLLWLFLLVGSVTLVRHGYDNKYLEIFEVFYRVGSLVFGGGVVIVPML